MAKTKLMVHDVPRLLKALSYGDAKMQQDTLGLLCPCRNKVYDREIWREIFRTYDEAAVVAAVRSDPAFEAVRHRALHAIQTLHEKAASEPPAQEILDWLTAQGVDTAPRDRDKAAPRAKEPKPRGRVTFRDVPRLLETLSCGEADAKTHTLELLCPCRNRRYDKEVWLAIFDAYENGENGTVRDQAGHAIDTLRERARTDPRTQELLLWLAQQNIASFKLESAVPVWKPNLRGNGLYIPRFEHAPRSKANRKR